MAKRSCDPRVAYPEVKFRYGNYCKLWVLLPALPYASQYSGTIRFIEPQGLNEHRRPVSCTPSSGTPRESQAKFK